MNFNKQPAVWIGIIGTLLLTAVQQFVGNGVLTADSGETAKNIIQAATPVVLALITRSFVWSPASIAAILIALGQRPSVAKATELSSQGKTQVENPTLS